MFCTHCGKPLEDGAVLCPDCGAPVAGKAPSPAPIAEPAPEPVPQPAPAAAQEPPKAGKKAKAPKAPKPPKAEKPPKPLRKQSVPARVGCVLLSILLCAALLVSCGVTILRASLSGDALTQWVENVDLAGINVTAEGSEESVPLADYLYDIAQASDLPFELTRRDVQTLLEDDLLKEFRATVAKDYQAYFLEGSSKSTGLTTEMVLDFIHDNESAIKKTLRKTTGTKEDLIFNYDDIEAGLDEYLGDSFTIKAVDDASGGSLAAVRALLSPVSVILCWVVCALLALLLVLLCLHTPASLLLYIGIPVLIVGALLTLMGVACFLAPVIYAPISFLFEEGSVLTGSGQMMLIVGLSMLAVGVILTVIRSLIGKARKKRLAAAQTPTAV